MFQSITTIINDNELVTNSTIPETGEKCSRHYYFTDDECVVVRNYTWHIIYNQAVNKL